MNKRNLTWFTLGSLASSSLSFISIPIIAWMFPDADIGKVALLLSVSGVATILFSLGLDQSYTREFNEAGDRTALLLNVCGPGAALLLALAAAVVAFAPTWPSRLLFGEDSVALSAFVFAYLFIVLVSRFLTLSLRMQEDGKRYALSFLLAKLVFVGLVCLAYRRHSPGLVDLLAAHGASVATGLLFLLITNASTLKGFRLAQLDWSVQKRLLAFGLPVATSGLLFWGLEGVDKFLLRTFSSYAELGVYSIALSISAMATVLTSMFTTVWIPVVYRWVGQGEDLSRIDGVSRHILAAATFLLGATGALSWLLRYALPEKHVIVQDLIPACMLWPILYAVSETTGLGIAIARATRLGLLAAGVALTSNVVLNLILLPTFGSRGAAAALACSIWVFFFMRTEISHRTWRPMPRASLYLWTLSALALAVAHALMGEHARSWFAGAWTVLLVLSMATFRDSLRQAAGAAMSMVASRRSPVSP